jgi:hypothetical protein
MRAFDQGVGGQDRGLPGGEEESGRIVSRRDQEPLIRSGRPELAEHLPEESALAEGGQ